MFKERVRETYSGARGTARPATYCPQPTHGRREHLPCTSCACPDEPCRQQRQRRPSPRPPGLRSQPSRRRTDFENLAAPGYARLSGQRLGTAQAGGSEGRYDDPAAGLPVYDTYLKSGQALADIFTASAVDTFVFDIQDVGARFYTCIWTLYDCMEAAQLAGKHFVVLDRPNPVTGRRAQGPVLHREFATFVGRQPISQAHGMTVAELARLCNGEFLTAPVALDTVLMSGWRREEFYDTWDLPWVPPSPNMPTPDTALVYSGTCLFEGTNLSEGRGTTRPFELLGAEGLDGRWAAAANELGLSGVHFREAHFAPTFSRFQGKKICGVQIHVHDRPSYDPVRTGVALLVTARRAWSGFAWRPDNWIDKLTGSTRVRTMIDAGASADEVVAGRQDELRAFRRIRKNYLLYG